MLAFLRKGVGLWLLGVPVVAFLQACGGPNSVGERGTVGISAQRGWLPMERKGLGIAAHLWVASGYWAACFWHFCVALMAQIRWGQYWDWHFCAWLLAPSGCCSYDISVILNCPVKLVGKGVCYMAFLQRYLDPSLGAVTAWHFCARKLAPKLAGARFNWHCCDTMMAPCEIVRERSISKWHCCGFSLSSP